jgi:hypothetical protein
MTQSHIDRLAMCLRIKGFGKIEALAEALALRSEEVQPLLAALVARGLAEETRAGFRLSPAGRTNADEAFTRLRAGVDPAVIAHDYENFIPINDAFKNVVTRWQMRSVDGKQVRNDHSDAAYDEAILAQLGAVHDDISRSLDMIAAHVGRIGDYKARLASALAKVRAGDARYITAPDRDSYHTIWFELHQELIGLIGTTRQKEAAAGRAV